MGAVGGSLLDCILAPFAAGRPWRVPDPRWDRELLYQSVPMMQADEVLAVFRQCDALLEGHFQLSSGLHSPGYLQCARVLQHPAHAEALGAALAARVASLNATVVLSPALGGIVIGHEVARAAGCRALFAERRDGQLLLRRGFRLDSTARVLVVEDVVTTGGSTRETIAVARGSGASVVGAAAIIDRGDSPARLDMPFYALAHVVWPAHEPASCPGCAAGVPIIRPGSRRAGG